MTGIPGDAGAYVAMTREALDRILPVAMASPYLPALLASTGLPVRSIPVEREVRPAGKSAYSEWARLRLAYHGLSAAWKLKRRRVELTAVGRARGGGQDRAARGARRIYAGHQT